ncbi:MAG: D-alanine--D-alanine ligase family protein [Microthrixaceae bacterium]
MHIELPEVNLPERVRLVMLFGGRSAEHDISCISATHVLAALDRERYQIELAGITRQGSFVAAEAEGDLVASGEPLDLLELLAQETPAETPTVVVPVLHGPNGEDGTIQGFLETAGVPYVGSGVLSSAVAMDKDFTKRLLAGAGTPQTPWCTVYPAVARPSVAELRAMFDELGPTVFVKPANMGSSVGVARVDSGSVDDLDAAIRFAAEFDDVVLVEAAVGGREIECAVLGNDDPIASVLGEVVTDAEFYDYSDKYFDGTARTVIPAELDEATMQRGRQLAVDTFRFLRCAGLARVDLFLDRDGRFLVNEVNTFPGFTPISMYPKLWIACGVSYPRLIDELVALALESHERRSAHSVTPEPEHQA